MKKTIFTLLSVVLLTGCSMGEQNADIMFDLSQKKADKLTGDIIENVQERQKSTEEVISSLDQKNNQFGLEVVPTNVQNKIRYSHKNIHLEFSLSADCHYREKFSSAELNDFSCVNISATPNKSKEIANISTKDEFCEFLCRSWGFKNDEQCVNGRKNDIDKVEKTSIAGREFVYSFEASGVDGARTNYLYLITKDYIYKFSSQADLSLESEKEAIENDRSSLFQIIETSDINIISN